VQTVTYEEDHLVKRHRGTMPVILTCPHGGDQSPPGVKARTKEATPDECQFTTLCCTDQQPGAVSPPQRHLGEANVLRPPKLEHAV
jgi:hypothetical protein